MKMSNEELINLLRRIPLHEASHKVPCPSSRELVDSFAPSASNRLKSNIIDHISECPKCREAFEMLVSITECDLAKQHSLGIHHHSFQLLFARLSSLIVGCLLIFVSILIIAPRNDISHQFREETTNIVLEYPTVSHNIADLLIFRWNPYAPARYYILELFDDALLPVWTSSKTEDLHIQVPEETRSFLQPGKAYFWMITAYSETDIIKESNLVRFVIRED